MGACLSATKSLVEGRDKVHEAPAPENIVGPVFATAEETHPNSVGKHHHHNLLRSFLHRITREGSLQHLIRHPHHHPFESAESFGLDGCFETLKLAGRGGSGQTWLCKDKVHSNKNVAVKLQQRPISSVLATMTYNEIVFQGTLSEGSIFHTPIYEAILTPTHIAQIMEYEQGGNMAEYISKRVGRTPHTELILPEDEARFFFKQLVAGVGYMHSRNTAHRDIKLDNCLLDYEDNSSNGRSSGDIQQQDREQQQSSENNNKKKDPLPVLKLADFQFVYSCTPSAPKTPALLGTPVYMAPELLETRFTRYEEDRHKYDPVQADVWACGVWLVAVLIGAFPFDYEPGSDNVTAERQIFEEQKAISWKQSLFVKPYLRKISAPLRDLLDKMLEPNTAKRISMAGVKIHPWVNTPLQPEYEIKWRQLQNQQMQKRQLVAGLNLDQAAIKERNDAVWKMVSEAEDLPSTHHHHLFHRRERKERDHHHDEVNGDSSASSSSSSRSSKKDLKEIFSHGQNRKFIDVDSFPGGCKIDMRLSAVSK